MALAELDYSGNNNSEEIKKYIFPTTTIAKSGSTSFSITEMKEFVSAYVGVKWGNTYNVYMSDDELVGGEYKGKYFNGSSWVQLSDATMTISSNVFTIYNKSSGYSMPTSAVIFYK